MDSDQNDEEEIDYDNICLICSKEMPLKYRILGDKAKETVINASKKRVDNKFKTIEKIDKLKLHKACYTYYTDEAILSAKAKLKLLREKKSACARNEKNPDFYNFKEACFICDKTHTRNKHVPDNGTVENMVTHLKQKKVLNEEENFLLLRLTVLVDNFADLQCFYHYSCYTKFYRFQSTKVSGPQMSEKMKKVFDFVVDFMLKNKHECQFSVNRILKKFEGDSSVDIRSLKSTIYDE